MSEDIFEVRRSGDPASARYFTTVRIEVESDTISTLSGQKLSICDTTMTLEHEVNSPWYDLSSKIQEDPGGELWRFEALEGATLRFTHKPTGSQLYEVCSRVGHFNADLLLNWIEPFSAVRDMLSQAPDFTMGECENWTMEVNREPQERFRPLNSGDDTKYLKLRNWKTLETVKGLVFYHILADVYSVVVARDGELMEFSIDPKVMEVMEELDIEELEDDDE